MTENKESKKKFYAQYQPLIDGLLDKHASEVSVHDLSAVSGFANVFIVAISRSELHGRTLRDEMEDRIAQMGLPCRVEGENSSRWTLLDCGDLIVNILSREGRDFYRLDSLWGDAPTDRFRDEDD